jgi:hypothetical protein
MTSTIVRDGVAREPIAGQVREMVFSPNGERLACRVYQTWPYPQDSFVAVDGEGEFPGVQPRGPLTFSPDSKHLAFCGDRDGQTIVILDGKELPMGDDAGFFFHDKQVTFSPDSQRWAYIAQRQRKVYAVISGAEYGPYDFLSEPCARHAYIYFSPDSRHFAFMATRMNGPKDYLGRQLLVVDGVEHEIQGEWLSNSLLRFDSPAKLHGLTMGKERLELLEVEIVGR